MANLVRVSALIFLLLLLAAATSAAAAGLHPPTANASRKLMNEKPRSATSTTTSPNLFKNATYPAQAPAAGSNSYGTSLRDCSVGINYAGPFATCSVSDCHHEGCKFFLLMCECQH